MYGREGNAGQWTQSPRACRRRFGLGLVLLELLLTIVIIAILAAVLIPNLFAARSRAFDSAAQACANELLTQGAVWAIDNNTFAGFDGNNAGYIAVTCSTGAGGSVNGFAIVTANAVELDGTVDSLSGATYSFSNLSGIQ